MTRTINVHEAKTHLSRLLDEVAAGEEIVLAKAGKPYARLVPINPPTQRPLGFVTGVIGPEFFEALPGKRTRFVGVTVLLDTHTLLWALVSPDSLSSRVRALLVDRATDVLVSAASAWEIATKFRIGKLDHAADVVANYADHLRTLGATDLAITSSHALLAGQFTLDHRDPFDRVIAAQALSLGVPVVTKDDAFEMFACQRLW